jgi:hypothetical protein
MSCGSSAPISDCHAAPVRHSGGQHCSSQHCDTGSHHCGAASCHAAPVLDRVEEKIFVFVFTRKFREKFFREKSLQKFLVFAKSFCENIPYGM